MRGVNGDTALAPQCDVQRTIILVIVRSGTLRCQRDLGHAVALGLYFITSSKVIAHRFFIVVKGHLDLEVVHHTGRHGELHRFTGAGGDGTLACVLPVCFVFLIGRIGIAHCTAVRIGNCRAEDFKYTGGTVIVHRGLVGLVEHRRSFQRHDLQFLLRQCLQAAVCFHIDPRHIRLVGIQSRIKNHIRLRGRSGKRNIMRGHIHCRSGNRCRAKCLGLLRCHQIHRRLLDAPRVIAAHCCRKRHAGLRGLLIGQMYAGGIRVEHAPDKLTGIYQIVGCIICRYRQLIFGVWLQCLASGEERNLLRTGIEVERRRGVAVKLIRWIAVNDPSSGHFRDRHSSGIPRHAIRYVADVLQRLAVIRHLDRTLQSRSRHLPLGYAHRRQRTVGGTHCHGILTAGSVAAVSAAFAAGAACARRTGSAALTGAAGGAGRALLSGLTIRTILTVRAVNRLDIQLGYDLPPRLQLRQHNGILRRHRQLCHRQLIGTAVNELRHRIDLHALIRFDIAFLGNGHPQVIRRQQMYDVVGRDRHLHIVLHLADVPL